MLSRNSPKVKNTSLPVTLAFGHDLKFANTYHAHLLSEQSEEGTDSYETDECIREMLGTIFLSEGDSSFEADGNEGNDDFTFERRGNDDFDSGMATRKQLPQVNAYMPGNSAGFRRQVPISQ